MKFAALIYFILFLVFGVGHAYVYYQKDNWDNFDLKDKLTLENLIAWVLFFVSLDILIDGI